MKQTLFLLFLIVAFSNNIATTLSATTLHSENHPSIHEIEYGPIIVSNHDTSDNKLKDSIYNLLDKAHSSILFISFSFTDQEIIKIINNKAALGIKVHLVIDRDHLAGLKTALHPSITIATRTTGEGHVHHKILVVDRSYIWHGSANFTPSGLTGSKNLAIACYSEEIAEALHQEAEHIEFHTPRSITAPLCYYFNNQLLELYLLPHNQPQATREAETLLNKCAKEKLCNLIDTAKEQIKISIDVLTYKDASHALIRAHQRGIHIEVVTSSLKEDAIKLLLQSGINVKTGHNLHQKFMLIDNKTLLNGSANWSMNAFSRSDESFIVLYDLTKEQLDIMKAVLETSGLSYTNTIAPPARSIDTNVQEKQEIVERTISTLTHEIANHNLSTQEDRRLVTIAKKLVSKLKDYLPQLHVAPVPGCCHYSGKNYLRTAVTIAEKQERIEAAVKLIRGSQGIDQKVSDYFTKTLKKLQQGINVPLPDFYHATRAGLENIIATQTIRQSTSGAAGPGTYVSCNNEGDHGYGTHTFAIDESCLVESHAKFFTGRKPGTNVFYSLWTAVSQDIPIQEETIAFIDTSAGDVLYVTELLEVKKLAIEVVDRATSDGILRIIDLSTKRRELPSFNWTGTDYLPTNLYRRSEIGTFRAFSPELEAL